MQYTDKYKLNLIERTDAFSPDALNDNARKVENALAAQEQRAAAALAGETAERKAAAASLEARVKVFEAKKFVYGICSGLNQVNVIHLGFTPIAVIIHYCRDTAGSTALTVSGLSGSGLDIIEGGFQFNIGDGFNIRSGTYSYLAFG